MKQFIFFQFLLFFSLQNTLSQNCGLTNVFTIPLGPSLTNQNSIELQEIANNIEYIKLEFRPECALGRIQRLVATEDFFFVFDNRNISQFSRSGKYIRKIGKIGRGPGEYPGLSDFAVDESTQRLFILANFLRQIFVYDFNGNYVKSIRLNEVERESIDITEDGFIVLQTSPITKSLLSTEIINQQGISILKFESRSYLKLNKIQIAKVSNIIYLFNKDILLKEGINDTVYKIRSKNITPYYVFNLGKYKPPINYSYEERGKYLEIYKICESDKYITTFFFHKGIIGVALYNKATKITTVTLPEDKLKRGVKNDIDNGINFFMSSVPFTLKTNKKEWLQILEPNLLNDYKDNKNISGNFKTIIDQFNDGDNPVIMVINLK